MTHNRTRDLAVQLRERVVPAGGNRYGLVVGIEDYRDTRLNLRCAAADAQVIFDLMTDSDCGMFPRDNVRLLLNGEATREGIWRALASLRRSTSEQDTVWIYYAGHGAPEETNTYWVTHEADVDDLYGTGLSNDDISKVLGDIRAKRMLVLLDCCHAAATAVQKNPTRAIMTADELLGGYAGHGRITLSSSDGAEKSVELGDLGHGAFTYYLERGLRGEADANGDGVVTADELWSYLRSKVTAASRQAGNAQTPVLLGEMRHDFALSLNPIGVGQKRALAELVESLVGMGESKLSTNEGEICLGILARSAQTSHEHVLVGELRRSLDVKPSLHVLKVLIASASSEGPSKQYVPTPAMAPSHDPQIHAELCEENDVDFVECERSVNVVHQRLVWALSFGKVGAAIEYEAGRDTSTGVRQGEKGSLEYEETMKCSRCNHEIESSSKRCPECGTECSAVGKATAGLETLLALGQLIQDEDAKGDRRSESDEGDDQ